MDANVAKIEELVKRITHLEKRNVELQSQIDKVVTSANERVNDLKAQVAKLQSDYDQTKFNLTSLENKFRNLSR